MATGRCKFQAHVDSLPGGDFPLSLQWVLAEAVGSRFSNLSLTAGDNDFSALVPLGTNIVIFVPPIDNPADNIIKYKGNASDTGIDSLGNLPSVFAFNGGLGTNPLIINSAIALDGCALIFL